MEELKPVSGPRAMIFAAGLGTRLRPLTDDRPKALVEVAGIPLLEIQLRRLQAFGFEEVVVNVHHFADMVEQFLLSCDWGMQIHISDERDLLRDTGGGLLHAAQYFAGDAPIFICNVDVLSDLDPLALMHLHASTGALATLALRARETDRYLIFDAQMQLCGWENRKTGATKGVISPDTKAFAFSGMQVVSPALLRQMGQAGVFSIIDTYLALAPTGRIHGWHDTGSVWMDVGKPAELAAGAAILDQVLRR
jgi:N-acetyl-alpha-D-muramate 1-phosphate uridylyltransferase